MRYWGCLMQKKILDENWADHNVMMLHEKLTLLSHNTHTKSTGNIHKFASNVCFVFAHSLTLWVPCAQWEQPVMKTSHHRQTRSFISMWLMLRGPKWPEFTWYYNGDRGPFKKCFTTLSIMEAHSIVIHLLCTPIFTLTHAWTSWIIFLLVFRQQNVTF